MLVPQEEKREEEKRRNDNEERKKTEKGTENGDAASAGLPVGG